MVEPGVGQWEQLLTTFGAPALKVQPAYCSKVRHRRSECNLCVEHCPVGAIQWAESLQVDSETCTHCGICATVCPTGVFEARDPTDAELFTRIKELARAREWVAFACPRYLEVTDSQAERFVRVPCLGRLDESILMGAVAVGVESMWLMDGACQGCPQAMGRAVTEQVVQRSNALLEALGVPQRIAIVPHVPPEFSEHTCLLGAAEGPSRRAFFSVLARETARTAAVSVKTIRAAEGPSPAESQAPRKGELPVRLPAKRQLLLAALGQLKGPAVSGVELPGGLFARLDVEATCTGCQMCAFFCPTGALTKAEQDGEAGVAFRVVDCVNCGLCRDVCYRDAVVLYDSADLNTILDDVTEVILMRNASAPPGLASPEEKLKRLQAAMHPATK